MRIFDNGPQHNIFSYCEITNITEVLDIEPEQAFICFAGMTKN